MSHTTILVGVIKTAIPEVDGVISPPPHPSRALGTYLTVQSILNVEHENIEGPSGLQMDIMQVTCWHEDYDTADAMRGRVKAAIRAAYASPFHAVNHRGDAQLFDGDREKWQLITRFNIWFET